MKKINLFYIILVGIFLLLLKIRIDLGKEVVSFYGFAENKETEINFNYPVAVGDIMVRPGEFVEKNTTLLSLYRIKSKEQLEEEPYKIAELKSEQNLWKIEKQNDIKKLEGDRALEIEKINSDIQKLEEQRAFEQSLYEDLNSVKNEESGYNPLSVKIETLKKELILIENNYSQQIASIKQELEAGKNPYLIAIDLLKAEQEFQKSTEKQYFEIKAPKDGLIGNIQCREEEHIPSFKTLMTFYEPNPTLVKGFVQEDLSLSVSLRDSFVVRSTKDPEMYCYGEAIGLGSRIIEIPGRLRKIDGVKTYGREVLVSIPPDNHFLQKEKVILEFVNPPDGSATHAYKRSSSEYKAEWLK